MIDDGGKGGAEVKGLTDAEVTVHNDADMLRFTHGISYDYDYCYGSTHKALESITIPNTSYIIRGKQHQANVLLADM